MAGYADELRKLGKLKRTRANFEKVQAEVEELTEHGENAEQVISALNTLREAASELESALNEAGDENPLLQWSSDIASALAEFMDALPGEEGDDIGGLIEEASSACENYEQAQDDRDYSADDREEAWGALLDALENVASAIE